MHRVLLVHFEDAGGANVCCLSQPSCSLQTAIARHVHIVPAIVCLFPPFFLYFNNTQYPLRIDNKSLAIPFD